MYGFCPTWVWSGLVWSGRRRSSGISHGPDFVGDPVAGADVFGRVRVVELRNDTTRPDKRQSLARPVPNSSTRTQSRPDRTRPDKVCGLVENLADPTDFVRDPGRRPKSGRARLVEFRRK